MVIKKYTDAELRALPSLVIEQGTTDAQGVTRGRHLRNPFAGGDANLARRWSEIHFAGGADDGPAIESDPFELLRDALSPQNLWHEARDENGKLVAVHPFGSKGAAEWENRCEEMHNKQVMITVPDKPSEPMRTRPVAEQSPDHKSEPIKFEDSEESARLRRGD